MRKFAIPARFKPAFAKAMAWQAGIQGFFL
jgi:hypothetical protein